MSDQPAPPIHSDHDRRRRQEAEQTLQRAMQESESIGSSSLAQRPKAAPAEDDAIEIWGRRIGRSLGAIAVVLILWQLASMMFAPRS